MSSPSALDAAAAALAAEPGAAVAELVVLVDDSGAPLGTADKSVIHDGDTPLHLAFSCHIFRPDGHVLVTRRAVSKRTFPGVWTNSFCGHPAPDEAVADAVRRRAARELGLELGLGKGLSGAEGGLELVLPDFRYRATDAAGIVENEICPVFRAVVPSGVDPAPASDEVDDWAWVAPAALRAAVEATPFAFSPWLVLQLAALPDFGRATPTARG